MTTQALALPDPSRGLFWAIALPLAAVLIVVATALVDWAREPRRDPADVLAVVDLRTARRAMARVDRLDLESSAAGAAAFRHLMSVRTWAASERHFGSRRRQDAVADLLADARGQLAAMGHDPDAPALGVNADGSVAVRIVEPRDGALTGPNRYRTVMSEVAIRPDPLIWHVDRDCH